MAVGIDVELMHEYYDATTNTSTVTATVVIDYTKGSYNGYNPPGTLVVNGQSYDFNSSFNYENGEQISQNGSVVAYTTTITVPHNDDGSKTVYASASFDSGISSGTVTTSNSLTLPNGTGSGGGSDGGSGDSGSGTGGSGGSSSGGSVTIVPEGPWRGFGNNNQGGEPICLFIDQGEHTTVKVFAIGTNGSVTELKSGDSMPFNGTSEIIALYDVDYGYEIDLHTLNGDTFNSGAVIWSLGFKRTCYAITTTAKKNELEKFNIYNGSGKEDYDCFIDNGTTWVEYTPHICVEDIYSWEGLFEANVKSGVDGGGVYVRKQPRSSAETVCTVDNFRRIIINSISISEYGEGIWANVSCLSYGGWHTGWCALQYLDFIIYGKANNESGVYLYSNASSNSGYYTKLNNEYELNISELVVADGLIWGYTSIENINGSTISGYVKMSDIGILSERRELKWVPCARKKKIEPVKYLYKNGVASLPSNPSYSGNSDLEETGGVLRYSVENDNAGINTAKIFKNTSIDVHDYKYLCVEVGKIKEVWDGYEALRPSGSYASGGFYIGFGDKTPIKILNCAMKLTSDDSNGIYYADLSSLSSIDFFGSEYFLGFASEGSQEYKYYDEETEGWIMVCSSIKEIWLSNEVDSNMTYKPFNHVF